MTITKETLTHERIEAVLAAAGAAGDADTVALARIALGRRAKRPPALQELRYGTWLPPSGGRARRGWARVAPLLGGNQAESVYIVCTRFMGLSLLEASRQLLIDQLNAEHVESTPNLTCMWCKPAGSGKDSCEQDGRCTMCCGSGVEDADTCDECQRTMAASNCTRDSVFHERTCSRFFDANSSR